MAGTEESSSRVSRESAKRVLIVGATGFCGRALVEHLAQTPGYVPVAHIRPESKRLERAHQEWEASPVELLITPWSALPAALHQCPPDFIVSLIGTTKRSARQGGGNYEEVDAGLNLSLIAAAAALSPLPHFFYLSSMGIEWARWSAYLRARVAVEEALESASLPATVLRPGLLAGESRDELRPLEAVSAWFSYRAASLAKGVGLRTFAHGMRPLDAPELAEIIIHLLSEASAGRTLQSCYPLPALHAIREERVSVSSGEQRKERAEQSASEG